MLELPVHSLRLLWYVLIITDLQLERGLMALGLDLIQLSRGSVEEICSIGSNVVVSKNASLRNSVILEGATIGNGANLESCIIGEGAMIPPNAVMVGEIIVKSE